MLSMLCIAICAKLFLFFLSFANGGRTWTDDITHDTKTTCDLAVRVIFVLIFVCFDSSTQFGVVFCDLMARFFGVHEVI